MSDQHEFSWACLEGGDPRFTSPEIMTWPSALRGWMFASGVLRETTASSTIACPCCPDGHIEEVLVAPTSAPPRHYIPCPENLRVEISEEDLRQWVVGHDALARLIAIALSLRGRSAAIVPSRLWRLGTTSWRNRSREIMLARRLHADDAAGVAAHIGREGRPIVLVPSNVPAPEVWPGRPPACIALERVITFDGEALSIDGLLLFDLVDESDRLREQFEVLPLDPKARKLTVRRQVKAEIKGHLEDDVLIAARIEHGSLRKAAKALTEQLGRPVTKDRIKGAIDRAGGLKAIAELDDSASIQRAVASQPRDRQKKIAQRR